METLEKKSAWSTFFPGNWGGLDSGKFIVIDNSIDCQTAVEAVR